MAQIEAVLGANVPALANRAAQPGNTVQARVGHALVELTDLRGDLHTHTNLTDGIASLADMVAAARARGYAYYAVTDHAPNLVRQQMTDEKMLAQRAEVAALADRAGLALLHGTELNIGPDGSVDWEAGFLPASTSASPPSRKTRLPNI